MMKPLLSICLMLVAPAVLSQETDLSPKTKPVPAIAQADWEAYRDDYQQSQLCDQYEATLWSCEADNRVFSLCSSPVVNSTSGYMQYRASRNGQVEFVYPPEKRPPLGFFNYYAAGNGDASIEFSNDGYEYRLLDPLRTYSSISVTGPPPVGRSSEIECDGNQTLQLNYTMRLMYDSGLWER